MRVLLIEDDSATAQTMDLMLRAEGFNTYVTDLGEEGVDLAKNYEYDAITLDLNLPDINGLEVLRQIRAAKVSTPVLVVTGSTDIGVKVKAFGAGADDFLGKPFHKDELVARIHAVVRRSKGHTEAAITAGPITVNIDSRVVEVNGRRIHLTSKEYAMLELLALRKGQTITKDMFLNHLYGGMDEPELKIIDVFICKLRGKLAKAGAPALIETVWGRGYVLRDEPPKTIVNGPGAHGLRVENQSFRVLALLREGPLSHADLRGRIRLQARAVDIAIAEAESRTEIVRVGSLYWITPAGEAVIPAAATGAAA